MVSAWQRRDGRTRTLRNATARSPLSDARRAMIVEMSLSRFRPHLLPLRMWGRTDAAACKALIGMSWPLCFPRAGRVTYCAAVDARHKLMDEQKARQAECFALRNVSTEQSIASSIPMQRA